MVAKGNLHLPVHVTLAFAMILASVVYAVTPAPAALASPIQAGFDYFETPTALYDFSSTPIPAGFFDPGSEPFDGRITLRGVPLGPDSTADTIVKRVTSARFDHPFPSPPETIPIEIVALNLVSVQPITVTYSGCIVCPLPEQWTIKVDLSQSSQPKGSMTIIHVNNEGGTFDSVLPVQPRFTFTRLNGTPGTPVTPGAETRVLDFGAHGLPPTEFRASNVPWVHRVPADVFASRRFAPSVDPNGERVQTSMVAQLATHNILPARKLTTR